MSARVPYILQYYFSMKMLQSYTFRILIVPAIVTFFFLSAPGLSMTLLHFCVGAWHGSARSRKADFNEICGQTEATPWHSSHSGHLSPLWFPSSRRYLAAQAPPVLPLVYLSWVNSQDHLEDWWDPFNKKDFFRQKEIREKPTLQWEALPKAGQTSVADFWTLPAAWMKGNFLSLQFASDTQGTGFLNQPGHFKLSGNIPQNCHAQLQHSYRTLLDEIIPPTSSAEKSFTCFCFQLIMVYHWFIILDPTSVSFSPLMWSQKWYFLSSPCGELAFSDSNRHGRRCKRRVGETLHVIVGWMPTPYLSGLPARGREPWRWWIEVQGRHNT